MSDIPNTDDANVSMNAIRWEITKHAVLRQDDFTNADIEGKIDMLVYSYAKTLDIYKKPGELDNPFNK